MIEIFEKTILSLIRHEVDGSPSGICEPLMYYIRSGNSTKKESEIAKITLILWDKFRVLKTFKAFDFSKKENKFVLNFGGSYHFETTEQRIKFLRELIIELGNN